MMRSIQFLSIFICSGIYALHSFRKTKHSIHQSYVIKILLHCWSFILAILSLTDEGKLETGMSVDWTWSSFYHNCSGMNKDAQNHTMMSSLFPPIYASQIFFSDWINKTTQIHTFTTAPP